MKKPKNIPAVLKAIVDQVGIYPHDLLDLAPRIGTLTNTLLLAAGLTPADVTHSSVQACNGWWQRNANGFLASDGSQRITKRLLQLCK